MGSTRFERTVSGNSARFISSRETFGGSGFEWAVAETATGASSAANAPADGEGSMSESSSELLRIEMR